MSILSLFIEFIFYEHIIADSVRIFMRFGHNIWDICRRSLNEISIVFFNLVLCETVTPIRNKKNKNHQEINFFSHYKSGQQ